MSISEFSSIKTLPRFIAAAAIFMLCGSAFAASWYVSPSGNDSNAGTSAKPLRLINTAVTKAKAGDTILLQAGTYSGTGDVDLVISEQLTIASVSGAASTIIDCQGTSTHTHDAMSFMSAGSNSSACLIESLTFEDGYATNGGALNMTSSYVNISGCVFSTNTASMLGGALYTDATSSVQIVSSSFPFNNAGAGGACDNDGTLVLQNCTFNNNSGSSGGAIYNDGFANVTGSTFSSNQGDLGAAVANSSGTLKLSGCSITDNISSGEGGAVYNTSGQVSMVSSQILRNQAHYSAGAIFTSGQSQNTFLLENCVLAGNTSAEGGAIYATGPMTVINCTFTGNSATGSSGGGAIYVDTLASVSLTNDILWADTAPMQVNSAEVLDGGQVTANYSDINLTLGGTGNLNTNPLFVSASGGNYHIQSTSPCLYKGLSVNGLTYDISGRLWHNPPSMGAYEGGSLWTAIASAVGPNKNKRILWANLSGEAALWTVTPTGVRTAVAYGPTPGYTPVALAVGPNNDAYLTWQQASGEIAVWDVAANGTHTGRAFNPGAGWSLMSLSVGPDSSLEICWVDVVGHLWIWTVPTSGAISYLEYGPE
ncbi:MAG TPA: right-handed parallel beta-helix repeat-containing protein [Fimbriimonadaceae bacterium]|jgi:predicted outer membrane repeat protein